MSEDLPEGWAPAELADLISGFEAGRNLRSEGRPASENEYGVLKISAVTWGEFQPSENKALLPGDEPKPHERIRKNDLLVTRANTSDLVGAVVLVDRDHPNLMLPDKILRLCAKTNIVESGFLLYALRTPAVREHFEGNATGTSESMRNLSQPKLAAAPVPLAPLPEQRRIFAALEALMTEVSAMRARLAKVPLILKRFRNAVLSAACCGRLSSDWREGGASRTEVVTRNAIPTDGEQNTSDISFALPTNWEWYCIDDACEDVIDYRGRTPPVTSAGIPHLRTTNVRDGRINWQAESFVSEETYEKFMTRGIPRRGDVLFTMEAPMGEVAVVDDDRRFSLGQRILLLRGRGELIVGEYMAVALQCRAVRDAIDIRATGTTVKGVAYKRFKFVQLPIPPLAEQREIVRRVDALFALADSIERRLAVAIARTDKVTQAILAKAFRGELVPTEADLARAEGRDYEPAGVLLERIRKECEAAGPPAGRGRKKAAPAKGPPKDMRANAR